MRAKSIMVNSCVPLTPGWRNGKPAARLSCHLIRCFVCRRQLLRGRPASMTHCDRDIIINTIDMCQIKSIVEGEKNLGSLMTRAQEGELKERLFGWRDQITFLQICLCKIIELFKSKVYYIDNSFFFIICWQLFECFQKSFLKFC